MHTNEDGLTKHRKMNFCPKVSQTDIYFNTCIRM